MTNNVAEKIKRLRKSKGFSQEDMADKLHISQSAYARIENGETNSWINHINKLCESLDVKPEELISNAEQLIQHNQDNDSVIQNNTNNDTHITINQISEKLVEQYEERIAELKEQVTYWKNKSEGSK
ncbi:helix-turn-helix domain-containing protein [Chryseobacterium indoltheticum]|uniref:Anaerobic benzoate catabolism transcriptional regulator n=1 Tax=Chryseobacterium indoltheticum TaxID=254 RepID=A0A381FKQ7_9FLAO|nr:helix-turn-helix transcriptional regulator [Chryseobacterium indoltheticum]SUX47151.1 anaerobic benzoate catabolism transcriptional regulator [Chryseobacterium indoltheticum]